MKVCFTIPEETLDAAVAIFSMKWKKAEDKNKLKEALVKAKQADVVEIPADLLAGDGGEDADAMYFTFAFAALATFLKDE